MKYSSEHAEKASVESSYTPEELALLQELATIVIEHEAPDTVQPKVYDSKEDQDSLAQLEAKVPELQEKLGQHIKGLVIANTEAVKRYQAILEGVNVSEDSSIADSFAQTVIKPMREELNRNIALYLDLQQYQDGNELLTPALRRDFLNSVVPQIETLLANVESSKKS